ncbi:Tfp pilus assembly protein FimT/FimU [Candidatus Latescibacterota bacterium]
MKRYEEKGFTLVEIIIVMVILGIMVTMAVPRMNFILSKDELRASTSSVTSSLYLARMKAVNDGLEYGVQFNVNGEIQIMSDPLGVPEAVGGISRLEDGISFSEIEFVNWLVVFSPYGQLEKSCLTPGDMIGSIIISNDIGDSTKVEVTSVTGRIRETSL